DAAGGQRAARARRTLVAALSSGRFGLNRSVLLPLVLRFLAAMHSFIAFREDSHFYLFAPFPVVRRLALELGRRLAERGVLEEDGDVFFLEIEEIGALGPAAEVCELVRRRRRARQAVAAGYTAVPAALLERASPSGEVCGAP